MKVLLAASEVSPIIKLGGLGDVVGSLPKALMKKDVNIDVIVPFYPSAEIQGLKIYKALELNVPFDGQIYPVEVHKTQIPNSGVDTYLLRNAHFFNLGGKSAFLNTVSETEMFMFFNRAVVEFIKSQFNTYDLVHCNDWHTGMITHLLQDELAGTRPATLFTIHNIMYQGVGDPILVDRTGFVPGQHRLIDWDLEDGDINMMLQGITSSDYVNTVSVSYAHEIVTKEFGGGFSDILRGRSGRLSGILNGLDYSEFPRYYDVHDVGAEKLKHKQDLLKKLGLNSLEGAEKVPLFSFVGRLDPDQKGLDILHDLIVDFKDLDLGLGSGSGSGSEGGSESGSKGKKAPEKTKIDEKIAVSEKPKAQFIILGVGDPAWGEKFKKLAEKRPDVSAQIVFDTDLAREIYVGSDFLLVPSKYEPCGLIQMIAMWYGTLPIVHGVGGLRDSVEDGITGFVFDKYNKTALAKAAGKAVRAYYKKDRLKVMIRNAMQEDFSWGKSADEYKALYERVVKSRTVLGL